MVGGPGSGKSLLSERIREGCNFATISLDALIRETASAAASVGFSTTSTSSSASSTAVGLELRKMLRTGTEVDVDICVDLLRKAILKALRGGTAGVVLDGFPKNLKQVVGTYTVTQIEAEYGRTGH